MHFRADVHERDQEHNSGAHHTLEFAPLENGNALEVLYEVENRHSSLLGANEIAATGRGSGPSDIGSGEHIIAASAGERSPYAGSTPGEPSSVS
jgi:hypothetical protein